MSSLILYNALILAAIAVVAAVVLYIAAKKFYVQPNGLAEEIAAILPQANGGAC